MMSTHGLTKQHEMHAVKGVTQGIDVLYLIYAVDMKMNETGILTLAKYDHYYLFLHISLTGVMIDANINNCAQSRWSIYCSIYRTFS